MYFYQSFAKKQKSSQIAATVSNDKTLRLAKLDSLCFQNEKISKC
jgi:hypothetical protein